MDSTKFNKALSGCISCIVILLALAFIFGNFKKYGKEAIFSENENRYLSTLPQIRYTELRDGEVSAQLEEWFSDHFAARELFMNVRAGFEKFTGKTEINGVYLCKDGYIIEKPQSNDRMAKIAGIFKSFDEKINAAGVRTSVMSVPTAITIYADKLPRYADGGTQQEDIRTIAELSGLDSIDVTSALFDAKAKSTGTDDEALYYKTDHHWTTYGAYIAYRTFCESRGMEPLELPDMHIEKVSDSFRGTVYSKVSDFSMKGEDIWAYSAKTKLSVQYSDLDEEYDTPFAKEYLDKKDKYSYFLNNLHPYVLLTDLEATDDKELVIIKDSYANCLVPMLTKHYKRIHVFDPRSYKGKISDFVIENNITDVLILYNMGTINNDTGIGGIL